MYIDNDPNMIFSELAFKISPILTKPNILWLKEISCSTDTCVYLIEVLPDITKSTLCTSQSQQRQRFYAKRRDRTDFNNTIFFTDEVISAFNLGCDVTDLCRSSPGLPIRREWRHRRGAQRGHRLQPGCAPEGRVALHHENKVHRENGKATRQRMLVSHF